MSRAHDERNPTKPGPGQAGVLALDLIALILGALWVWMSFALEVQACHQGCNGLIDIAHSLAIVDALLLVSLAHSIATGNGRRAFVLLVALVAVFGLWAAAASLAI